MNIKDIRIFKYNPTKILLKIPVAILILFAATFFSSRLLPGDPVKLYVGQLRDLRPLNTHNDDSLYQLLKSRLQLDKPLFYFSVKSLGQRQRPMCKNFSEKNLVKWSKRYESDHMCHLLLLLDDKGKQVGVEENKWKLLLRNPDLEKMLETATTENDHELINLLKTLKKLPVWKHLIPTWEWNGTENQFHQSLLGFVSGNWGTSIKSGEPVFSRIKNAFIFTFKVQAVLLLLAFFISKHLGLTMALYRHYIWTSMLKKGLDILFVVPVFVMAFFLLRFFGSFDFTADVALPMSDYESRTISLRQFWSILPAVICLLPPTVAFLSRQIYHLALDESKKVYIQNLWLRGVTAPVVFRKFIWKNVLANLSGDLARLISSIVTGSLVVEMVFSYPGMGRLLQEAIFSRDWPLLTGILWVNATVVILAISISEILLLVLIKKEASK